MKQLLSISLLLYSVISFSQKSENDDYIILRDALQYFIKASEGKPVYLYCNTTNSYTISVIESQQKSLLGTLTETDSYHDLGKDSIFDKIFNDREFDYLLSQKSEAKWDIGKLKVDSLFAYDKNVKSGDLSSVVIISRPVYTRDKNYALVEVGKKTWKQIAVYRKENDRWIACNRIAPIMISPKIELWRG